jgi:lysine decarboxylase
MLKAYKDEDTLRLHMPGHKGRLPYALDAAYDVTEIKGIDDLQAPTQALAWAQEAAAEVNGAGKTMLSTCGSTAAVTAMLLAVSGRKVIATRDCHRSAISAIALGGIDAVFAAPQADASDISKLICEHTDAAAVYITYPDYYGRCCDIAAIAEAAKEAGMALLVDNAHGAHFPYSSALPVTPSYVHADAWAQSAHKTLPALTQAAYLHIGRSSPLEDRLRRAFWMVHSSSPSYLIMLSLDAAREYMQTEADINGWISECKRARERINRLGGYRCAEREGAYDYDVTRLNIITEGRGYTGYEADAELRKAGVQAEMADISGVVLITAPGQKLDRLILALDGLKQRLPVTNTDTSMPLLPPAALSVRQAMMSDCESVDTRLCSGRICAEATGAYPPGIAAVVPGEIITDEIIEYFNNIKDAGAAMFGERNGRLSVLRKK